MAVMTSLPLSQYFVSSLFRALLEGERVGLQDAQRRVNQHQRERIIGSVLTSIKYISTYKYIQLIHTYIYIYIDT